MKIDRICENEDCGRPFMTPASEVARGQGRFCSHPCAGRSVGIQRTPWDEHFLDELTIDGAYILGFFLADGHLRANGRTIVFSQKEHYILVRIARALGVEKKLVAQQLALTSEHAWSVLRDKYAIPVHKSASVRLPQIDEVLMPHLIRGLFDGDGHVAMNGRIFLFCSGSAGLVDDFIRVMVETVGLPPKRCKRQTNSLVKKDGTQAGCFVAVWSSMIHSMAFARFIYGDDLTVGGSDLYLTRKKARLEQLFVPWRDKEWLWRESVEKGRSCADIAGEFGILPPTVGQWISKLGVQDMGGDTWF